MRVKVFAAALKDVTDAGVTAAGEKRYSAKIGRRSKTLVVSTFKGDGKS
jgi:hypothetical protein